MPSMPSSLTKLFASTYFKYIVLVLAAISHATALATYLQSDGHVQAATIVSACVAISTHVLQFLSASGVPGVTVEATTHIADAPAKVQTAVAQSAIRADHP